MKKAIALVLALVFVFSMSTMAFADEEAPDLALTDVSSAISNIVDSTGLTPNTDVFKKISDAAAEAFQAIASFDITKVIEDSAIAGIIEDFREVLENIGISTTSGTISELFKNLKQKIKDLYCGAAAELPEMAEPEAEEYVPATGSSATAGIAAFATLSVAAAAAFVCTKKKVA